MTEPRTTKLVTQRTLDLWEKHDRDLGLLDERWASKKDRDSVSEEEAKVLGQYIDHLHYLKGENLSKDIRQRFMDTIDDLESYIEDEVVKKLRNEFTPT